MFPICDLKGHVLGFGARALDDSMPKYLNSPQTAVFDKSSIIYGINLAAAAIREQDQAVIVEGYMDVITAHQNGFSNVVAAMGTAITELQVSTLKRLTRNIVLALDADEAGEEAMLRGIGLENVLSAEIRVITLPQGKDPDDVIRENTETWRDLLDQAVPIVDYTFNMVAAGLDLTSAKGKSLAADRLLPVIGEIKDPVRQAHYLQKLARLVNVTERNLEAALRSTRVAPGYRQVKGTKRETARTQGAYFSPPFEEHYLALLLKYFELKDQPQQPLPEYFENSENREVFTVWREASDLESLRAKLDPAVRDHLDHLLELAEKKETPADQTERRFSDFLLRMREKYLRNLEKRRGAALALEAELGGSAAALAKLEQGREISSQLSEVFTQKRQKTKEVNDGSPG
jgi:DNA primase